MLDKSTNKRHCEDGPRPIGDFVYQSKAIATAYSHVTFKSRLEARWAAFFDLMGWQWTYEPYDLDGWIPDFQVGTVGTLVEVKPFNTNEEWMPVARKIEMASFARGSVTKILLLGASPYNFEQWKTAIGLSMRVWPQEIDGQIDSCVDKAVAGPLWGNGPVVCQECYLDWRCLISGIHHGSAHCVYTRGQGNTDFVWEAWRKASNATQWRHNK